MNPYYRSPQLDQD